MLAIALLLQDKLAEDTLSKIDQQIAAFRSLSVEVRAELRSQAEDHEKKESFSGKILLKDGGKARLDLLRVRDNKESSMLIISNGTTVADTREGETLETPTPKDFNKNFSLAALALTGVTKAHMLTFEVSAR
jgi:outer membrane lipoprotein-sorting protein